MVLSIVVPVFNGEQNLRPFVRALSDVVPALGPDCELIFVDDGSTDGSLDIIKKFSCRNQDDNLRIKWISLEHNSGQQAAVLCGLRHASGEFVVTMDDDLAHPPGEISRLLSEIRKGHDAVYAVAGTRGTAGSLFRNLFFTMFLGKPPGLKIGSFRIFNRKAVELIKKAETPFVYVSAELFRHGLKTASVEYIPERNPIACSKSRYSSGARVRLYLKLIRWYGPFAGLHGMRKKHGPYMVTATGGF